MPRNPTNNCKNDASKTINSQNKNSTKIANSALEVFYFHLVLFIDFLRFRVVYWTFFFLIRRGGLEVYFLKVKNIFFHT